MVRLPAVVNNRTCCGNEFARGFCCQCCARAYPDIFERKTYVFFFQKNSRIHGCLEFASCPEEALLVCVMTVFS